VYVPRRLGTALGPLVIAACVLLQPVVVPTASAASIALPKVAEYTMVAFEWDGSQITEGGWRIRHVPAYTEAGVLVNRRRQAEYNPPLGKNVEVVEIGRGNQAIKITTRRHCTTGWTSPLIAGYQRSLGQNEFKKVCPRGLKTRYSTGRIESKDEKSVKVGSLTVARAKLPTNGVAGTRFAIWMMSASDIKGQTPDTGYCSPDNPETNLSELDLLEWYGKSGQAHRPHMGSHIGCKYTYRQTTYSSKVIPRKSKNWVKGWHRFSVEATESVNRYYLDSARVSGLSWKDNPFGMSSKLWRYKRIPSRQEWESSHTTETKYRLIVQGEVFTKDNGKRGSVYYAPSNSRSFPAQSMLVDFVTSSRRPEAIQSSDGARQS